LTAGILLAGLVPALSHLQGARPFSVYHDGADILFVPEATSSRHVATFGPWTLGSPLSEDKPQDQRLNLYVVLPGIQYRSSSYPEYDHNMVVNKLTVDKAHDWDVYWCFVLDPSLDADLRSERELLAAAQEDFHPPDLFDVEDVPAHEFLTERLHIRTLEEMRQYRRKGGSFPRLLIVPAHIALRATTESSEPSPAASR